MPSMLRRRKRVSPYQPLWNYIRDSGEIELRLTFDQIAEITGIPFDAKFLFYQKEALNYGYYTYRLSTRDNAVSFCKVL